jgi:hypothetical protein
VYRSALRRTGSIAFGLPEDDGGCDALEDDMLAGLRRSVNGDHGSEGCCCAHYNPGKLAHGSGMRIGKLGCMTLMYLGPPSGLCSHAGLAVNNTTDYGYITTNGHMHGGVLSYASRKLYYILQHQQQRLYTLTKTLDF